MPDTQVEPIWSAHRISWIVTSYRVDCPEHGRIIGTNIREWRDAAWERHLAEHHGDSS